METQEMQLQQMQPPNRPLREGYQWKLCKNGKYRQQKILSDEEKQLRVQKMQEGRKAKKQAKLAEKETNKQTEAPQQQTQQLTRKDVEDLLKQYTRQISNQTPIQQQPPAPQEKSLNQTNQPQQTHEQKSNEPAHEQQPNEQEPQPVHEQQQAKQKKRVQKIIKSPHVLIPDRVEMVSVSE